MKKMCEEAICALVGACETHPLSEGIDVVKFLYQGEFGGEHLLSEKGEALDRLRRECAWAGNGADPLLEPLGDGIARLHLRARAGAGLTVETVGGLFLSASTHARGDMNRFLAKLSAAQDLCAAGKLPVSPEAMRDAISSCRAKNFPAVSHSETYRKAYKPAYRLVPAETARFLPLFQKIDAALCTSARVFLAIDGPCAGGKTTLARWLKGVYDANILSMDDFFLPPAKKTPARLAQPGGNVDSARFLGEVAEKMRGGSFSYRPYSCKQGSLLSPVCVTPKRVTIVEGVYSHLPALRKYYDLTVFLLVDPLTQRARILERNGPVMAKRFAEDWIPLENQYFSAFGIQAAADLVF